MTMPWMNEQMNKRKANPALHVYERKFRTYGVSISCFLFIVNGQCLSFDACSAPAYNRSQCDDAETRGRHPRPATALPDQRQPLRLSVEGRPYAPDRGFSPLYRSALLARSTTASAARILSAGITGGS